jgi:cold shock CspA family protein
MHMQTSQKQRKTRLEKCLKPNVVRPGTRREWRRGRPLLQVGDTEVYGKVVAYNPGRLCGFIKPENGAARIHFTMHNVPYDRQKCVGIGRNVYFDVVQGKPLTRRKVARPTLTAKIRSSSAG